MLVGITGTLGAGKGTVVEYLKNNGFTHYSASGKLRELVEARGLEANRKNYSELANEIRSEDPYGLVKLLWAQYQEEKPDSAIIESLHDVGEAEFIKKNGGIIFGVDADLETRYSRVVMRGSEKDNVSFEDFREIATYEEEGGGQHHIRKVIKMADYVIENNGTLEALHKKIDAILAEIADAN